MTRHGITLDQVAYVGDDLNDIPAFDHVGVRFAVANAVQEIKEQADYVTKAGGGAGAGREVIDHVLRTAKGLYSDVTIAAYVHREIQL